MMMLPLKKVMRVVKQMQTKKKTVTGKQSLKKEKEKDPLGKV